MAHVFIVDDKTFKVHLNYMFAGTGAKKLKCDYLVNMNKNINSTIERLLTGMIADISRIRIGDKVLFYLQQNKYHEGMFFGSFKVKSNPFLSSDNFLESQLGKRLTFRVLLEPDEVYPNGITERTCLDSLENVTNPSQMCWSLIYRKLKANRGCTMITDYEYNSIMNKIRNVNKNALSSNQYDFNTSTCQITKSNSNNKYDGQRDSLDIYKRLLYKNKKNNAFESHLQAYVLQNLERIKPLINSDLPITWIGNEVSCGVGMQSIDVAFIQENKKEAHFVICELKDEQPVEYIKKQIDKYVIWMKEYIIPTYDKKVIIHPTIIAPYPKEKTLEMFKNIKDTTKLDTDVLKIEDIKYIGFTFDNDKIKFEEIVSE